MPTGLPPVEAGGVEHLVLARQQDVSCVLGDVIGEADGAHGATLPCLHLPCLHLCVLSGLHLCLHLSGRSWLHLCWLHLCPGTSAATPTGWL